MAFDLKNLWQRLWPFAAEVQFVIEFTPSGPVVRQGRPPRSFLEDCQAIAVEHQVHSGRVTATGPRKDTTITVKGAVPAGIRQRLRNSWSFASRH